MVGDRERPSFRPLPDLAPRNAGTRPRARLARFAKEIAFAVIAAIVVGWFETSPELLTKSQPDTIYHEGDNKPIRIEPSKVTAPLLQMDTSGNLRVNITDGNGATTMFCGNCSASGVTTSGTSGAIVMSGAVMSGAQTFAPSNGNHYPEPSCTASFCTVTRNSDNYLWTQP